MATRHGVGESNDLVKLLDEYQLQVPNKFKRVWEFNTIPEAEAFVKQMEDQGRVLEGRDIKVPAKDANGDKIKGEFLPVLNDNGKIEVTYCPVGEMVVKCVEKAAKMMKSPVHITGAYLTGQSWASCH